MKRNTFTKLFFVVCASMGSLLATGSARAQTHPTDLLLGVFVPFDAYDIDNNGRLDDDDLDAIDYALVFPGPYPNWEPDVSTHLQSIEDNLGVQVSGANPDGQVTAIDKLLVINFLGRGPFHNQAKIGDVNDDGLVNSQDLIQMINYLSSLPSNVIGTRASLPSFDAVAVPTTTPSLWVPKDILLDFGITAFGEPRYYDTNGDSVVDWADYLTVLNNLGS